MLVPIITEYTVINESYYSDFITAVNKAIKQGWQPLGPVIKYSSSSDYYQTLVKYEQPKTNSI